jgi:hypothetical protein
MNENAYRARAERGAEVDEASFVGRRHRRRGYQRPAVDCTRAVWLSGQRDGGAPPA